MPTDGSSMPYSSLRPLPVGSRKPKNLSEFIGRVHAERGFRNITEASLRAEIQAKFNGEGNPDEDTAMSGTAGVEEEDNADDEPKNINAAKAEILRNIDAAHNTAMLSLDFISLLLSKHSPNQAGATLSQALREFAGIGTIGVSKFKDSDQEGDRKRREEKRKEAQEVSIGWTIMEIDRTKVAAEKTTTLLAKEIDREANYWKEVLAVKQNGWSVCRLPAERHTLGVRFGFTEASPEFRNNSLAPLRRGDDGAVILEQGRAGSGSQNLSVSLTRKGEPSGQSIPKGSLPDSSPLQSRVLEARNTIFAQELWHELHREAHSLASYGVRASDTSISYEPTVGPKVNLALDTLTNEAPKREDLSDNKLAELTQLSLQVLLSYAHRDNEVQRLRPSPPHIRRNQQFNQYHLIRPIVSQAVHDVSVKAATRFVGDMTRLLRLTGHSESSFILNTPRFPTTDLSSPYSSSSSRPTAAQALINTFISPSNFELAVNLTSKYRLRVRGRTWFLPMTTTQYEIQYLPPPEGQDQTRNVLQPGSQNNRESYPDLRSVKLFFLSAVSRVIANEYAIYAASLPQSQSPSDGPQEGEENENEYVGPAWTTTVRGNAIRNRDDSVQVSFEVIEKEVEDPNSEDSQSGTLELVVTAAWHVNDEVRRKAWRFGCRDQEAPTSVSDIVATVVTAADNS